jgi:hypothetical protein
MNFGQQMERKRLREKRNAKKVAKSRQVHPRRFGSSVRCSSASYQCKLNEICNTTFPTLTYRPICHTLRRTGMTKSEPNQREDREIARGDRIRKPLEDLAVRPVSRRESKAMKQ